MRHVSKTLATLLVAGLAASSPASAAPVSCASGGLGGGAIDTVGEWRAAADGCFLGDKLYTSINSADFVDSFPVGFSNPASGLHQFVLGSNTVAIIPQGGTAKTLVYSVEIYLNPLLRISAIDVDTTGTRIQGGDYIATKRVVGDVSGPLGSITSIDGVPGTLTGLSELRLTITESFSATSNSILNTAQNSITQTEQRVPEPGTLALLGLGLAGLAATRRRKQ